LRQIQHAFKRETLINQPKFYKKRKVGVQEIQTFRFKQRFNLCITTFCLKNKREKPNGLQNTVDYETAPLTIM